MGAIIGMAQNFVGSNNLNLLTPSGQFGSRLMGGNDASSPRYIFTALEPIVRTLFPREDDAILEYLKVKRDCKWHIQNARDLQAYRRLEESTLPSCSSSWLW